MSFVFQKTFKHSRYTYYHLISLFSLRILFEGRKLKLYRLKIIQLIYDPPLQGGI